MTIRAARLLGAAVLVALGAAGAVGAAACSSSSSGSAPAIPVEVGTVTGKIEALVVVGDQVVCATTGGELGAIVKIPTAGGPPTTFADKEPASQLVTDGTTLVWHSTFASLNQGTHEEIKAAPVSDGTSPKVVVPKAEHAFTSDGSFVYWTVETDVFPNAIFDVKRTSIADGTETTLATAQVDVAGLAVDDVNLYYGSDDGIWSMPKGGGTPVQLLKDAAGLGGASSLLVDDTRIYYIGATGGGATTNFVASVPKTGGATRTSYGFGCQGVAAIAIDGDSVYGLCNLDIEAFKTTRHHTIRRAPKGGGDATTIGEISVFGDADPDSFDALAIAGGFVYVGDESRLVKVPK